MAQESQEEFPAFAKCLLMQTEVFKLRNSALHLHSQFRDPFDKALLLLIQAINAILGSGKEEDWVKQQQEWSQTLRLLQRIKNLHAQAVQFEKDSAILVCNLLQRILLKAENTSIFTIFPSIEKEISSMESTYLQVVEAVPVGDGIILQDGFNPEDIVVGPVSVVPDKAPGSPKRTREDSGSEQPIQKKVRVKAVAKKLKPQHDLLQQMHELQEECEKRFHLSKVLKPTKNGCTIKTFTGAEISVGHNPDVIYAAWTNKGKLLLVMSDDGVAGAFGCDDSLRKKHNSSYYLNCSQVMSSTEAARRAASKADQKIFRQLIYREKQGTIPTQFHVGLRNGDDWIPVTSIVGVFPFEKENKGIVRFNFK